ncbi:Mgl repressor and galactose ultrainduction factor [Cedecea davisae]|uniref:Putative HTH-type transcriptional regulator GalR n=1 Tax=Cedecea davisae DSM 4568 TaxID=566551 RepID=S3IZ30_9ENTR|nr:LacI family DNA-binding transcriptional regulator [Cedecea davisae]EPF17756.1 putative HTH-type transcriptional regulator GalR [Cedecea davisae DSM 4568]SUX28023.1 Mgl repressor and galactose ultrainduction factor [Cedecea davisae]
MVTLEDVAAHAGVSRATVSRVVNGDTKVKSHTRIKVEAAIAELGYSPNPAARALASSQSHTIGLVTTSYTGGFFGSLMDTVQSEAESNGKQLLVTQGRGVEENERNAIQRLYNLRCDGLVIHVRAISDETLVQLAERGNKFIVLDREVPALRERCVVFDHRLASQMATQYLLDAGHRAIACLHGPTQRASSLLRRQGFLDVMERDGIKPVAVVEGEYDMPSGYKQTAALLDKYKISALYCCNEEMAVGAMLAITERGLRIPLDISLICYDSGDRAAFVRPALTSIYFPIGDMARYATRKLLNEQCENESFLPSIVARDSVRDLR